MTDTNTPDANWHKIPEPGELGEGRVTTVSLGIRSFAVTRHEGRYGCLDNACPHQGGPLGEGSIENGWLRCPWHGYDYSPGWRRSRSSPAHCCSECNTWPMATKADRALERLRSICLALPEVSERVSHIRAGSQVTVVARRGWQWVGVTGPADLIGPDDMVDGVDADEVRLLLRSVFQAAGGAHDDYDEYDKVMAVERRTAVFVSPDRVLGNR